MYMVALYGDTLRDCDDRNRTMYPRQRPRRKQVSVAETDLRTEAVSQDSKPS